MLCPCITCGKLTHYSDLQAGHFLSGRGNAILFDEESVFAQCQQCNIFKHGNPDAYWPAMLKRYGQDKCMELVNRKHEIRQLKAQDYIDLYEKYYNKVKDLGGLEIVKLPKPTKQEKLFKKH